MVHKIFCYTNHYNICVCCIGTIKRAPFQQHEKIGSLCVLLQGTHTHICSSFRENPPVHSRTNAHSRSYTDTHAEPWYRFMCTPLALGAHSADKFALYALGDIDWSNHTTQRKESKVNKKAPRMGKRAHQFDYIAECVFAWACAPFSISALFLPIAEHIVFALYLYHDFSFCPCYY